jgi:hypothetical protein
MWPVVGKVISPVVDLAAHVAHAAKPVLRQALFADSAVEALDAGDLCRMLA